MIFLRALVLAWASLAGLVGAASARPNVLLIISDDQGFGDLSLHWNPHLQTPHLDALGRQSAQLAHFYVSPVCAPTRAALLTGRYPLRTGTWGVESGKETMRAEEITLAETLRDAGWQTALFGKWHNGEHWPNSPQGQGFREFLGFTRGHWNNYFDTTLLRGEREEKTHGFLPDVLTDEALKFLESNRDRPWFCTVAYNTPHSPFQVPDGYFERYRGLSDELACIYGMCANLDDNVGRLLSKLEALHLAEQTIVLFLSDNGPNTSRWNSGLRGRKGSVDEGGVRVPCFIRWPGQITPGVVPEIAAHIDVLPTLLDLCQVTPPPAKLDGASLAARLTSGGVLPERTLFVHQVQGENPKPWPGSARTQRWRAVNRNGKAWELYDIETDPGQQRDVAPDHAEVARNLAGRYDAWWRDVAPERYVRLPIPVGHEGHDRVELPAAEAREMKGLRLSGKHPNNAWLTAWTELSAQAAWELEVVRDGTYRLALAFLAEQGGARLRVSAGEASIVCTLPTAPVRQVASPDRVPREEVQELEWATIAAGELSLKKGRQMLRIEAFEMPGREVGQLKSLILERAEPGLPH